jgi:hypothetical protein
VVEYREVCITLLFVGFDSEEPNRIMVIIRGGLRAESDPTLCGLRNLYYLLLVALGLICLSLAGILLE